MDQESSKKIPTYLKHKPVVVSQDYDRIDGKYAYKTDAKGLSLGLAQWSDRGKVELSAKIWRHTGNKWSRQSEEMPMHRALDLAILICRAKQYFAERYHTKDEEYPNFPELEKVALQGGKMNIAICMDNEHIAEDLELFEQLMQDEDERIGERLIALAALLKQLGY